MSENECIIRFPAMKERDSYYYFFVLNTEG